MLSEWDGTPWAGSEPELRALSIESEVSAIATRSVFTGGARPWRPASIRDALGVPAIQRSVTLIANTTGAITLQAFRNSALMAETPRIVSRPDPYSTPRDFYRDTSYNMASRGECVWLIGNRDSDGYATALIVVPLHELRIEDNPRNRLAPTYRWGDIVSTRYSAATPNGRFVHITYLKEPGELRGVGPLQLGQAAVSVAVEAQEWAANFYGDGGQPSTLIKYAGQLGSLAEGFDSIEEAAEHEAEALRRQWVDRPNNVPRVIDNSIESVEYKQPNEQGSQMLKSRDWNVGEAARLFGLPGALLEYGVAGASLTYQNLADVWVNFVRGCLAPNYLEPIEQAMGDLLPRSTVTRFLTSGLYRADAKTRWEIYQLAAQVLGPDEAAEMARVGEDLAPGNPEVAPIPSAPPSAIPVAIPRFASREVRCMGQHPDLPNRRCNKLLSTAGTFVGRCPRCRRDYTSAA